MFHMDVGRLGGYILVLKSCSSCLFVVCSILYALIVDLMVMPRLLLDIYSHMYSFCFSQIFSAGFIY